MTQLDVLEVFKNFNQHTDDYLGAMYMNIFHEYARAYRIYYDENKELQYKDSIESFYQERKNNKYKLDSRKFLQNIIKIKDKNNINVLCYSPHEYLIVGYKSNERMDGNSLVTKGYNFLLNFTLPEDSEVANFYEDVFCNENDIKEIFKLLKTCTEISTKEDKIEFGIAAIDAANTLYTSWYQYTDKNIDIENNYNDDLPYDKICKLIESEDTSELMLFYGDPGTGKTSLIKHFISKYKEYAFVFIDGGLLANAPQEKLMTYFMDNTDTIFILEDCEKVLMNRENYVNPVMPVLLNVTDGIIGDVLKIKIICTFNTSLQKIDKALLRKGRLSLKYEFGKLNKEKVRKILNDSSINEDMYLSDIYNIDEENDYSKQNKRRIGF